MIVFNFQQPHGADTRKNWIREGLVTLESCSVNSCYNDICNADRRTRKNPRFIKIGRFENSNTKGIAAIPFWYNFIAKAPRNIFEIFHRFFLIFRNCRWLWRRNQNFHKQKVSISMHNQNVSISGFDPSLSKKEHWWFY